jgi:acyl CoA:acetate/3-ketoacid CoA transferase beta subunit
VLALGADAVLAGAGVANLAAWLAVANARAAGSDVCLTAEIGLWGYDPTPADPFVLNHRNFGRSTMLGDAPMVLGTLVGGPGTTTLACLGGAQVDRFGNVNSTLVPGGPFLVGSGGGNDVASVCAEAVVVATLTPQRTPPECGYVTSPGRAVRALVTDLGVLEKVDDAPDGRAELVLTAVPAGPEPLADRIAVARDACGWDLVVAPVVRELEPPTAEEIAALRSWDPRGWFLRDR